jgi:hypothetical protein
MYINPSFHDCLDEDGNFSEAKRDEQYRCATNQLMRQAV